MKKNSVLRKVLAVSLAAAMLAGTGFTAVGSYVGTSVSVSAAEVYGDFEYVVKNDNTVTITKYIGKSEYANIPDTIDNKMVTSIDCYAFSSCSGLTSVKIGRYVTDIDSDIFVGCTNLTSIGVVKGNEKYSATDGILFDKARTEIIRYPQGKKGAYSIPNYVKTIGSHAFAKCTGLTSIIIPDSVTYIEDYAFGECTELTSIIIPNSVTFIDSNAFSYCAGLTDVTLSNSVTYIGSNAFSHCTGLTEIAIPDSVTSIGKYLFYGCTKLENITVDEKNMLFSSEDGILFSKLKNAIYCCPQNKKGAYSIPDTVTYIGENAFLDCKDLTSITIPDNVEYIGKMAFGGCESLTSITIPNGVTSIDDWTFWTCKNLTDIVIPNSVTAIRDNAFGWTGFTSIAIPDSVTYIGNDAFCNCKNLTSVYIPESVIRMGQDIFYGCINPTIYGVKGSYAETYANKNNIPFATLATYIKEVAPTCTETGKKGYYHNDFDGKNYEDVECEKEIEDLDSWGNIPATGHNYTEEVIAPTATEQGYTLHTCINCGDSYKDNYTAKLLANNSVLSAETIKLGETITVTGKATGGTGKYLYNVLYKQETQSTWTTAQSYSTTTSVSIKPAKAVTYDVCVKVKDSANTEVKNFYKVTVTDNRPKNLSTISSSSVELGDTVVVKAKASGSTGFFQYAVYYKKASDTKWICRQSFKAKSVITFAPSFAEPYDVCVKVKDDKGTVVKKYFNVDVIKPQDKLINASAISANDIKLGERITVFSSASGSTGFYQYAVSYRNSNNTNWITIQDYSSEDIVQVKPDSIGTYEICVKVKDNQNNVIEKYFTVTVK